MSGDASCWLCIPNGSAWLAFFQDADRCRRFSQGNFVYVACAGQYIKDMCLEACYEAYWTVTPMCFVFNIKDVLSLR